MTKCNSCGFDGIWGQDTDGKWKIFDEETQKPHVCKPKQNDPLNEETKDSNKRLEAGFRPASQEPKAGVVGAAEPPQDRIRSSIHETGEYVPMRDRLITLQAVYKSQVQNVPELLPILSLEDVEDQETYKRFVNAYNRVMNLVMERTLSDARELIREAGKRE